MVTAKHAVDSTLKKVAVHTAEIIASVVLLIIVCLPLVFVVFVPISLIGVVLIPAITVVISMVSAVVGYAYVTKLSPSSRRIAEETEGVEEEVLEEDVESEAPSEELRESDEVVDQPEENEALPES